MWNASDFGNLHSVLVEPSTVWIPRLLLSNNAKLIDENEITPQSNYVSIYSDGTCYWEPRFEMSASQCPVDMTWFPFDRQVCDLEFESWGLDRYSLNLSTHITSLDLHNFLPSDTWNLIGGNFSTGFTYDDYPTVTFTLRFDRKPLYYVVNLIVPCCLLSFIAAVTFVLQPGCSERLGLTVTILLAMSVYQIIVSDKLPPSSDTIPLIVHYFLFVICMCVLAVVLNVVVLHLHLRSESHPVQAMPVRMKNLFCKRLAACLCMKPPPFPSLEPPLIRRNKRRVEPGDLQFNLDHLRDNNVGPSSHTTENESVQTLLKEIRDLLKTRVQDEEEQRYEDDKENEMKKDWMLAAAVLDRICAIAFTVIFVGGTLAYLMVFSTHD